MPWLPVKWNHLSFGVYMADEFSALQQCSVLPGVFKGPWEASTANEGTLARSCITPCPAQHSCSSYHFLPLTTWLWLWTASTFCISQTNVLNVFILHFYSVQQICTGTGGFLVCVIMCWFVTVLFPLTSSFPVSCTWNIKLNVTALLSDRGDTWLFPGGFKMLAAILQIHSDPGLASSSPQLSACLLSRLYFTYTIGDSGVTAYVSLLCMDGKYSCTYLHSLAVGSSSVEVSSLVFTVLLAVFLHLVCEFLWSVACYSCNFLPCNGISFPDTEEYKRKPRSLH